MNTRDIENYQSTYIVPKNNMIDSVIVTTATLEVHRDITLFWNDNKDLINKD